MFIRSLGFFSVSFALVLKPENQAILGAFDLDGWDNAKIKTIEEMEVFSEIVERYGILQVSGMKSGFESDFSGVVDKIDKGRNVYTTMFCDEQDGEVLGFVYRSDFWVEAVSDSYKDEENLFHRSPCGAIFLDKDENQIFVIGVHTDPDNTIAEMNALENVYESLYAQFAGPCIHPAVHFVGNMNAGCDWVKEEDWEDIEMFHDDEFTWWIGNDDDTTVNGDGCAYDRIISNYDLSSLTCGTVSFMVPQGQGRVFRYDEELGCGKELAMAISSHYPVEFWYEKYETEAPATTEMSTTPDQKSTELPVTTSSENSRLLISFVFVVFSILM